MLCARQIAYSVYIFYDTISMSSSSHIDLLSVLRCARHGTAPNTALLTMELRFNRSDLSNLSTFYSNTKEEKNSLKKPKTTLKTYHSIWSFFSSFQAAFIFAKIAHWSGMEPFFPTSSRHSNIYSSNHSSVLCISIITFTMKIPCIFDLFVDFDATIHNGITWFCRSFFSLSLNHLNSIVCE